MSGELSIRLLNFINIPTFISPVITYEVPKLNLLNILLIEIMTKKPDVNVFIYNHQLACRRKSHKNIHRVITDLYIKEFCIYRHHL